MARSWSVGLGLLALGRRRTWNVSAAQEDGLTLASATGAGVRNSGSHDVSPGSASAAAESAAAAGRWAPALARMQAVSRSSATEDSRLTSSGCEGGAGQLLAARASAARAR